MRMDVRNLKVMMSYRGTSYHGFQVQDNALAVQEVVERAVEALLGQRVPIIGCSRTDTGVHANAFCFNMKLSHTIPCDGLVRGLNTRLPYDIAVLSCEETSPDFHARFSCKSKEYLYKIWTGPRNPFLHDLALQYGRPVDEALIWDTAQLFVGEHDFAAFCGAGSIVKNTVRTIYSFSIRREGHMVELSVHGNGFLYNMVRILVGTLLKVNEGRIPPARIPEILASRDRRLAGKTAPPHGLYLNRVYY